MIPTEDASSRKREIEEKLKQEQDTLSFIRENLEKSDQLTKGMVSILSSFESRLMQLENSIIPVHKQTENLQRLQDNVEKTLSCLDHVISYYHVAKDTDKIIKEGPTGRLDEYLACIAKIQKAVEYFQDNNPDSPELNTVKARFEKGKELLEAEFRSLLTRYSKPVPPILILDLIGTDEDLDVQEEVTLEHLPEATLQDIICISGWLVEYGRNQDFMNVYFQIRSSQLDRSIKGLKEHFRKNSSSSGVLYSPAVQNKRKDTPTKKPPKRPGTIRKAQNLLKQYSQHGLDGKRGGSNLTPLEGKDDVLDIEIDSYMHCISAFVKLAQSEYQLLTDIIPEHHQKKTFDSLIQEALDNLMLEGDNIVSAARRAIMRHDYSAVLTIFPILKHLKQTKPEFDQVLQGTAASTKNKLPTLITSMETTGAKALEEFADSIKNDPDKEYNMPKDGTVHELTSNAILFLQQLLDFQETAGAMLASQVLGDTYNIPLDPRETSSSASSYSSEFSRRLLSTYICKVLGNLQLNLLSKSKVYEDQALSAIFLHNNYNYILKSLEKSELIQLVSVTQKKAEASYRELIEQQIQNYQRSWLKVIENLTDRNIPVFQPGAKLKDKERQMIKDKFKGFNDGLEELCKIQKIWAIPDKEQRDAIRQAQKRMVSEAYKTFLQRYANIAFTKNPEKYHKYKPEQVEEMIEKLFDTSA
ncbi:exocyst complex component 7 isoform X2 [Lepisosteus oculatus]|uniref:exocyst complex component 7 isoform X2 n=1 Tax=Lepisosteus oculatus TaxID=7918 RepID=UPI0003EA88AB|nr:PREDICTED: exocyst complex component 7 isoform X2 [Lepisosteus oculatus]